MELRLILKIYCISLIKDIFGLHDIMSLNAQAWPPQGFYYAILCEKGGSLHD